MIAALLLSFGVIFVAELGDKSQLMAMTYALRYRWWVVLLAITVATTAVHAVSVFFGHFLGMSLPTDLMSVLAGLAMLVFGLWTVYGDRLDEAEQNRASRVGASVFLAVMSIVLAPVAGRLTALQVARPLRHGNAGRRLAPGVARRPLLPRGRLGGPAHRQARRAGLSPSPLRQAPASGSPGQDWSH